MTCPGSFAQPVQKAAPFARAAAMLHQAGQPGAKALVQAGMAVIPPQRIALNPDCGFAPDATEPPSIDEAYEKLRRLATAARNLRGKLPDQRN